jgi:molybdate transport system substrate-binding protein
MKDVGGKPEFGFLRWIGIKSQEENIPIRKMKMNALSGISFFILLMWATAAGAGEVAVAVASNFAIPMERISTLFLKESGHTLKVSFGSSSKLYAQIKGGAAFDVLLAADEAIPKRLVQEGFALGTSRFVYATGKLVLWSAQPGFVDDKGAVLNKGNFTKLAIADPRLAPYGVAAKETLEKLIMWNAIQGKLVKGENITQTYQIAETENVEIAFIALSQIMRDGKVTGGSWWLVPAELHKPIRQSAVLLTGAKDQKAANAFLSFLKSAKAVAIMRGFGYELP